MKDITLKMTGKQQFQDREDEDVMEFVTEGRLYEKKDAVYVVYDETEVSGMAGCKTTIRIKDNSLRMKRVGDAGFGTELFFETGRRFNSVYNTPFGPMGIEVLTRNIKTELDAEQHGEINIEYDVSMEGMNEGKNKLIIKIM